MGQPGLRVAEAPGLVLEQGPDLTRVWKPAEVPAGDTGGRRLRSFPPQRQWLVEGTFYVPPVPVFTSGTGLRQVPGFTSSAWLYTRCLVYVRCWVLRPVPAFYIGCHILPLVPSLTFEVLVSTQRPWFYA